jgi:hypothetical protein
MPLIKEERDSLLRGLERKGWLWDGDFIYAPHRTMWLLGAHPWQGDVSDFHERMSARVDRLAEQKAHFDAPIQHQHAVEDTQSLVEMLTERLNARGDI